jgi:hypothetical protein
VTPGAPSTRCHGPSGDKPNDADVDVVTTSVVATAVVTVGVVNDVEVAAVVTGGDVVLDDVVLDDEMLDDVVLDDGATGTVVVTVVTAPGNVGSGAGSRALLELHPAPTRTMSAHALVRRARVDDRSATSTPFVLGASLANMWDGRQGSAEGRSSRSRQGRPGRERPRRQRPRRQRLVANRAGVAVIA